MVRSTRGWVIRSVACWSFTGGVVGGGISVIVNNALIEISLTPVFAALFGGVLLLLGALMVWRKLWEQHEAPCVRMLILTFSGLVLISGVSCFLLEKHVRVLPQFPLSSNTLFAASVWVMLGWDDVAAYASRAPTVLLAPLAVVSLHPPKDQSADVHGAWHLAVLCVCQRDAHTTLEREAHPALPCPFAVPVRPRIASMRSISRVCAASRSRSSTSSMRITTVTRSTCGGAPW